MDCREFREIFSDHLDDLLDEADEGRVREHLGACPCCRRLERAYRAGVSALHGLPVIGPARGFGARILHRVRHQPAPPAFAGSYGFAGALLAMTFAGLLLLDLRKRPAVVAPDASDLAERLPGPPGFDADSGTDLVTVRLVPSDLDLYQSDPYAPLPSPDQSSSSRIRFVVPAVWSGR